MTAIAVAIAAATDTISRCCDGALALTANESTSGVCPASVDYTDEQTNTHSRTRTSETRTIFKRIGWRWVVCLSRKVVKISLAGRQHSKHQTHGSQWKMWKQKIQHIARSTCWKYTALGVHFENAAACWRSKQQQQQQHKTHSFLYTHIHMYTYIRVYLTARESVCEVLKSRHLIRFT